MVSEQDRIGMGAAIRFSGDRFQHFEIDVVAFKEVGIVISDSLYSLIQ